MRHLNPLLPPFLVALFVTFGIGRSPIGDAAYRRYSAFTSMLTCSLGINSLARADQTFDSPRAGAPATTTTPAPGEPDAQSVDATSEPRELRWIERHGAEPVDPVWSPRARAALTADLDGLRKSTGISVVGVDCRKTICVGTVEWSSFPEATRTTSALMHHDYQLSCTRSILLLAPADPTAPYRANLIVDCGRGT